MCNNRIKELPMFAGDTYFKNNANVLFYHIVYKRTLEVLIKIEENGNKTKNTR
jgi:hypothetical protein